MMNLNNKAVLLCAVIFLFTACNKYLEKEPDNRTNITTPEQLSQLLTTAYPQGNYIPFLEAMSDNAEDKGFTGTTDEDLNRINRSSYRFEVVEISPDREDGPDFYWASCYKAIAAANQALEIIDNTADKSLLNPHRGEALLARAYAHFMLVTLFAKAYDPATADSDPGVPYVTTRETMVFQQYERKTVAFVYEMIEKDLLEGYPLIDEKIYGIAPAFHFNKAAAAAFAARFYLFKRDYEKVITYANAALPGTTAENLRPWNTVLSNLPYVELQAEYSKTTLKGNLLLQEAPSIWGRSYASLRYGLGEQVANRVLVQPNATGQNFDYPLYGSDATNYNIPKFHEYFVRQDINANTGIPYNTIPLLTAEEALLNRAEAYLAIGNRNQSIADLNSFASQNMTDYTGADALTTSKLTSYYELDVVSSIFSAILDFKQAFFIHEGLRWLDIIRVNIPIIHTTREGEVLVLDRGDPKRILQLPALTKQAGLEPNTR